MTTEFLDNKFCTFKILLSWRFLGKTAFLDAFSLCPPCPPPPQKRKFYFYCRLALSDKERQSRDSNRTQRTRDLWGPMPAKSKQAQSPKKEVPTALEQFQNENTRIWKILFLEKDCYFVCSPENCCEFLLRICQELPNGTRKGVWRIFRSLPFPRDKAWRNRGYWNSFECRKQTDQKFPSQCVKTKKVYKHVSKRTVWNIIARFLRFWSLALVGLVVGSCHTLEGGEDIFWHHFVCLGPEVSRGREGLIQISRICQKHFKALGQLSKMRSNG